MLPDDVVRAWCDCLPGASWCQFPLSRAVSRVVLRPNLSEVYPDITQPIDSSRRQRVSRLISCCFRRLSSTLAERSPNLQPDYSESANKRQSGRRIDDSPNTFPSLSSAARWGELKSPAAGGSTTETTLRHLRQQPRFRQPWQLHRAQPRHRHRRRTHARTPSTPAATAPTSAPKMSPPPSPSRPSSSTSSRRSAPSRP